MSQSNWWTQDAQTKLDQLQVAINQLNEVLPGAPGQGVQYLQGGGSTAQIAALTAQITTLSALINSGPANW